MKGVVVILTLDEIQLLESRLMFPAHNSTILQHLRTRLLPPCGRPSQISSLSNPRPIHKCLDTP